MLWWNSGEIMLNIWWIWWNSCEIPANLWKSVLKHRKPTTSHKSAFPHPRQKRISFRRVNLLPKGGACGILPHFPPPTFRRVAWPATFSILHVLFWMFSGPETGKRKRVPRKADGKLTLLVSFGGSWHDKLTLLVTHLSLRILAYPFRGRWPNRRGNWMFNKQTMPNAPFNPIGPRGLETDPRHPHSSQ